MQKNDRFESSRSQKSEFISDAPDSGKDLPVGERRPADRVSGARQSVQGEVSSAGGKGPRGIEPNEYSSEEKYNLLVESIDEGFCILEVLFDDQMCPVDYRYLEVNSAFEKLTGKKDVEGRKARDVDPALEDHWIDTHGQVALTGESVRFQAKSDTKYFDVYSFPFGPEGSNYVAVLFNDNTERKKAQDEREQLLQQVELERERLTDIFQNAPSFMAVQRGPDHVFERVNNLYTKLIGGREAEGKPVREVFPDLDGQGFFDLLDQVYETGEPFIGTDMKIVLQPDGDGKKDVRYLDFVYQPLLDADGSVNGIFTQGVDLTERKKAKNDLQKINETLEERVEERTKSLLSYQDQLRSLASKLSQAEEQERHRLATELHDNLGQMLAVNKMKMELLQKEVLPDNIATGLNEIKQGMEDALAYTRDLMSDLKPPPSLDNEDIIASIQWISKKMEKHDLKVHLEDDGQPKCTTEDIRTTLLQTVRELLFNVIKHTDVNEARVRMTREDNQVRLVVEDDGPGFDPEAQAQAATAEDGRFGLFNIRERMDLLGGSTEIDSRRGEGTQITLLAPLKDEEPEEAPEEIPQEEMESSPKEKDTKITVMLADDHQMMRKGLKKIVDTEDDLVVVAEASDGAEAVELARETMPDVIIMDVNMPRMDGIMATQEIMSTSPKVRIVGLSLHDHQEVIDSMRNAGATAYLSKNEAFETLCATIRSEAKLAKE